MCSTYADSIIRVTSLHHRIEALGGRDGEREGRVTEDTDCVSLVGYEVLAFPCPTPRSLLFPIWFVPVAFWAHLPPLHPGELLGLPFWGVVIGPSALSSTPVAFSLHSKMHLSWILKTCVWSQASPDTSPHSPAFHFWEAAGPDSNSVTYQLFILVCWSRWSRTLFEVQSIHPSLSVPAEVYQSLMRVVCLFVCFW